ncbi:MAG: hypothetical protein QXV35_05270 [Archaeoglobaceae archaeon]
MEEYTTIEEEVLEHERKFLKDLFKKEGLDRSFDVDVTISKIYDLIEIYKDLIRTLTSEKERRIAFKTSREDEKKLLDFIKEVDEFKMLTVYVDHNKKAIVVAAQDPDFNSAYIEHMLVEIAKFARKLRFKTEFEENIDSSDRLFIYDTIRAGQEKRSSAHFIAINNRAFKFFCSCEAFTLILSDKELFDDLVDALAYNDLQKARKILRDAENKTTELYKKINNIDKFIDYINELVKKIEIDIEMIEDLEKEFEEIEDLIF